jgi:hypothetical protein
VGAMIVNLAVTELAFVVVFVGGMILFWPDVRWGWLTLAALAVNGITPIVFYPFSKTLWVAMDILLHRMDRLDASEHGSPGPGARGRVPSRA